MLLSKNGILGDSEKRYAIFLVKSLWLWFLWWNRFDISSIWSKLYL